MADPTELKHMVMSFRVSELQVLLGFAGRNKSGRKQELLQRGLALVEKGAPTSIQIKIKDLYRRFPPRSQITMNGMAMGHTSPVKQQPSLSTPSAGGATNNVVDYRKMTNPRPPLPSLSDHNQVPVHPDVRFKKLSFYDVLGELLKPSSLAPSGHTRFQENFYVFHLTPQQAQEIASSRGADGQSTVQVQLRFCLMETTCPQEDNFPPSICVRVCGKMAPLPNPIPTNKPGVEPKRPSRPINITSLCRISPIVSNQVAISWASELGRSYCVSIFLVRKLNSDILLSRLKANGIKHPDHTRALIKEKLAHDPDSEIATTSLRVSLYCPLGKMRMTVPSRASTCSHLQCFDAPMFLLMNEKKPTWTCPVCDKPAEYSKLIIEGLFTEILKKAPTDCGEIEFTETGSWRPMRPKEKKSRPRSPSQPSRSAPPVEMIDDSPAPKKALDHPSGEAPSKPASQIMVDLTETDDEDDDEDDIAQVPLMLASSSSDTSSVMDNDDNMSSFSVISATPPSMGMPHLSPAASSVGATAGGIASISGCVSPPPVISIDTPPHLGLMGGSSPRDPVSSHCSPYSSPHSHSNSPYRPPAHQQSPLPQPPPAHSKVSRHLRSSSPLPQTVPPPAHSSHIANRSTAPSPYSMLPIFQGAFGADSMLSDPEFEDILNVMTGGSSQRFPPQPYSDTPFYPTYSTAFPSPIPLTTNRPDRSESANSYSEQNQAAGQALNSLYSACTATGSPLQRLSTPSPSLPRSPMPASMYSPHHPTASPPMFPASPHHSEALASHERSWSSSSSSSSSSRPASASSIFSSEGSSSSSS